MKFSVMFSVVVPPGSGSAGYIRSISELRKFAGLIESLGYHGIHLSEHHFQADGQSPSPLMLLAQVSGLTKRVRLVTNILVSTLYAPVQLLEDFASLDNLSEGRFTYGTSPGYVSEEFAGRGVSYADRFKLHEEIVDFIQHAWASPDDIGFEGKFFRVPHLRLGPPPVQKKLPIWYGVSGPKLLERAANRRVPLSASPRHSTAELKDHFARYIELCKRVGYTPEERPIIRETLVLDTLAEAERFGELGTNGLFGIYGRKSAEGERRLRTDEGDLVPDTRMVAFKAMSSRFIIGDPHLAKERVADLKKELNPTELVLRMQMPGVPSELFERSLRLFATEVMPHFA